MRSQFLAQVRLSEAIMAPQSSVEEGSAVLNVEVSVGVCARKKVKNLDAGSEGAA